MKSKNPKISVIMSCYNREHYIKDAIDSILSQTFKDFEFIIIDDCSTDSTANIIQSYADIDDRILFIRNSKNMDYNYNLRKGVSIAKGEYIARMDDDDISLNTRFEKQVKFLDNNTDITVLGTFIEIFGEGNLRNWVCESDPKKLSILMHFFNPICHPSVMIRRSFLEEHNLNYSSKELYAEEYHLWKEILLRGGKLANLDEVLVKYRSHKRSVTHQKQTGKIQRKTARKVKMDLLEKIFNSKKRCKKITKDIGYPFEESSPSKLFSILEDMKNSNLTYISGEALEQLQEKYCGKKCIMDIFFASDDKFSQHLCVAMTSILANSLPFENFNFYILDGGILPHNKEKINSVGKIKKCNIEFIKMNDALFDNCPMTDDCKHISKQTYYRFIIPQLKPNIEKSLYLDCDIVVTGSLNKLWNTDLGDNYVAAIEELWINAHSHYKSLDIPKAFNAGVLLINNKLWIQDNITDRLFKNTAALAKSKSLRWQDQDALNYTFNYKSIFVSPKYNLQQTAYFNGQHSLYTSDEMNRAIKAPIIIHFSGNIKPWQPKCRHPLWEKYYEYLKLTPYKYNYKKYRKNKYKQKITNLFYRVKIKPGVKKYKLFGITFSKKTKKDFTEQRYLFGIKYYEKLDQKRFLQYTLDQKGFNNNKIINQIDLPPKS